MKNTPLTVIVLFLVFQAVLATKLYALGTLPDDSATDNAASIAPITAGETLGIKDLDVNDVSILFPLPESAEDLQRLISIKDIIGVGGRAAFSEADFLNMVAIAESDASKVGRHKISLERNPSSPKISTGENFRDWRITGIRFDPSAPGASEGVVDVFGSLPQIRLIVQPVTVSASGVTVHDVAFHLIYDYFSSRVAGAPGAVAKAVPDSTAVDVILDDLLAIKVFTEAAGVDTDVPLNVHPGLASGIPGLKQRISDFLSEHLDSERFNSAAVMGLNNGGPEPWLFMSMIRLPSISGTFRALPSPGLGPVQDPKPTQMLSFLDSQNIQPTPSTTNLMSLSNSLIIETPRRRGVSTAILFTDTPISDKAVVGEDENGQQVISDDIKNSDIADIVANPSMSHFFNTDCMSCHSETTRREILEIPQSSHAFTVPEGVQPLSSDVTPDDDWNVRNFGWFRSENTITQRTANETAEVVDFIRRELTSE